ncbi:hypothetical protein BH09VER1_BH09VER1_46760 [soil metagenome]
MLKSGRMIPLPYGMLPTGEMVESYTLANASRFSARIITYGATLVSLRVPNREGRLADVVLGYPSQVEVSITHRISEENSLVIETAATTDQATPLSLTHHFYFNLAGEASGSVENHELQILSHEQVPADDTMPLRCRHLTVSTDEDYLQLYTGAFLDHAHTGKAGHTYGSFAGRCLECEGDPDGANNPALGHIILRLGQTYRHTTTYSFTTKFKYLSS